MSLGAGEWLDVFSNVVEGDGKGIRKLDGVVPGEGSCPFLVHDGLGEDHLVAEEEELGLHILLGVILRRRGMVADHRALVDASGAGGAIQKIPDRAGLLKLANDLLGLLPFFILFLGLVELYADLLHSQDSLRDHVVVGVGLPGSLKQVREQEGIAGDPLDGQDQEAKKIQLLDGLYRGGDIVQQLPQALVLLGGLKILLCLLIVRAIDVVDAQLLGLRKDRGKEERENEPQAEEKRKRKAELTKSMKSWATSVVSDH